MGELLETDLLRVQPHRGFDSMVESPSRGPAPPLPTRLSSSTSPRAWSPWAVAESRQMLSSLPWSSPVFLLASSPFSSQAQRSKAHTPEGARLAPACPQFSHLSLSECALNSRLTRPFGNFLHILCFPISMCLFLLFPLLGTPFPKFSLRCHLLQGAFPDLIKSIQSPLFDAL